MDSKNEIQLNMDLLNIVVISVVAVTSVLYWYFKRAFSYWESKGVPFLKPTIPYGNMKELGTKINGAQLAQNIYEQFKGTEKFCGIYFLFRPVAMLLDLELVKNVLIKDFANFNERGLYHNEGDDPLSVNLFSLKGKKWKHLRAKLTPTFTSGKMKFMFSTIVEVGDRFRDCLTDLVKVNDELEIKELLARFTTDVIGTCAFGIDCNSLEDPNAEFRNMGRAMVEKPRHRTIAAVLITKFKSLAKYFHVKIVPDDVSAFFLKVVRDTVDYREKNNVHRNDFMDLLIKLKNDKNGNSLSITEIAAQAFLFFLAGFETSSTTLTFCLYELALNPDIQEKTRNEIRESLKRHNGNLTYEAMMDMPYVDQVINETLRKYPPIANLNRVAQNDYPVPGSNHVIEKGSLIWIPVYAIQRDPEYYPDPDVFNPDRFTSDAEKKRDICKWLPFGEGPRNCIGLRFGMMQTRIGLVTLLNNFDLSVCPKTALPLVFIPGSFVLAPQGGIYLKLKSFTRQYR